MKLSKDIHAGQAVYTKQVLSIYDWWVLGISNTFIWRCPTKLLRQQFRTHTTLNHLDVGAGTGYFLDKCLLEQKRRIALLDLNNNSLETAAARIKRFKPEVYQANVLEPLNLPCKKFDSISISYLFHCLPGAIKEKAKALDMLSAHLNEGGKLFGSTILNHGVPRSALAEKLMHFYNTRGIFSNHRDHLKGLREELERRFSHVEITVKGCVAMFCARNSTL